MYKQHVRASDRCHRVLLAAHACDDGPEDDSVRRTTCLALPADERTTRHGSLHMRDGDAGAARMTAMLKRRE